MGCPMLKLRVALLGLVVFGASFAVTGCGGEESDGPTGPEIIFDVPEQADNVERLVTPTFEVAAASEVFMCMRVPYEFEADTWVNQSIGYQADGGHHTMLFYTIGDDEHLDESPHECEDEDMGNIRFVGVGTAHGIGISLPEGVAMLVPKGAKVWTQSHYLNTTSDTILVQDVIDLYTVPASKVEHKAGAYTQVDLGLELTPAAETTRVIDCTAPQEMFVPWMIPHMHEWGARFTLEVFKDGAEEPLVVYADDWHEALRDDFPVIEFPEHLHLTTNDRVRTTCTWNNNTTDPILFPEEMCATFLTFYPSEDGALLACDETGETFRP